MWQIPCDIVNKDISSLHGAIVLPQQHEIELYVDRKKRYTKSSSGSDYLSQMILNKQGK